MNYKFKESAFTEIQTQLRITDHVSHAHFGPFWIRCTRHLCLTRVMYKQTVIQTKTHGCKTRLLGVAIV